MSVQVVNLKKKRAVLSARNVYISQYLQMLNCDCVVWGSEEDTKEPDLMVFVDGPNVNPFMWGHKTNRSVPVGGLNQFNYRRDRREQRFFDQHDGFIPRFGFGRGALMLNIFNRGTLVQHVDGHHLPHDLVFTNAPLITIPNVPSNHSQMMIPSKVLEARWLASARTSTKLTTESITTHRQSNDWMDPEILYYPATRSLCWQPQLSTPNNNPLKSTLLSHLDCLIKSGEID